MKAISTPPGARGPPSAVQRRPFFKIQASKPSFASWVKRRSGAATPCKILWLFLVVRKTLGDGFGTYLWADVKHGFVLNKKLRTKRRRHQVP